MHFKYSNLTDPQEMDISGAAQKYFKSNVEIELFREARNIIDEWQMMQGIYKQQLRFRKVS
jgi:hypothetical protein